MVGQRSKLIWSRKPEKSQEIIRKGKCPMPDISPEELKQLFDEIDAEIQKNGLPTEQQLQAEVRELNKTAPDNGTVFKTVLRLLP